MKLSLDQEIQKLMDERKILENELWRWKLIAEITIVNTILLIVIIIFK